MNQPNRGNTSGNIFGSHNFVNPFGNQNTPTLQNPFMFPSPPAQPPQNHFPNNEQNQTRFFTTPNATDARQPQPSNFISPPPNSERDKPPQQPNEIQAQDIIRNMDASEGSDQESNDRIQQNLMIKDHEIIQNLIESVIEQHQCMFTGCKYDQQTNFCQLFEDIIVKYESELEMRDDFMVNKFEETLKEYMHQQSGHNSTIQGKLNQYLQIFRTNRQNQLKRKVHLMNKYDLLRAKYRQTEQQLKKEKDMRIIAETNLIQLKRELKEKQLKIQWQFGKIMQLEHRVKSLKLELDNCRKTFKDLRDMLDSVIRMKKQSEEAYLKSLEQIVSEFNKKIKIIGKQKAQYYSAKILQSVAEKNKYEHWFKILVDDYSKNLQYKKVQKNTYQNWMQKYLALSQSERKYGNYANTYHNQSQKAGIQHDRLLGTSYDPVTNYRERYQQLKQRIDKYK